MGVVGSVGYKRKRRPVYRPADSLPIDEGDLRALALAYDAALDQNEGIKNTTGNTNKNAVARLMGSGRVGGEKSAEGKSRRAHEGGDRAREREMIHHISSDAWNPLGNTVPPNGTRPTTAAAATNTKSNIGATGGSVGAPPAAPVGGGKGGGLGESGKAVEDHSVSAVLMSSATARGSGHLESPPQHLSTSMRAAHRSGRGDATNNNNNNSKKRVHEDRKDADHAATTSYDHDAEWMYQLSHYEKLHADREREKREAGRSHQKREKV